MTDSRFDMSGRVAVVTGGAGLLGREHAAALTEVGAAVVLLDIDADGVQRAATELGEKVAGVAADITSSEGVASALQATLDLHGRVDALVNNAANNPKVGSSAGAELSRLEDFPEEQWEADVAVGLKGAFLCARAFGGWMAEHEGGAIVNIASDLAVIAPDQRLYAKEGLPPERQPVKPVTYSVVKTGLVGLTRYLATYWADREVRANALSPGGVRQDQPEDFVAELESRIPLGRMAEPDEYRAAIQFLCSDASRYMTGQNLVVDGGRTTW